MSADTFGNDVKAVAVPVTGCIGTAPIDTPIPTPAAGAATDFILPPAFKKLGLLSEDGGPEWSMEPDGDPVPFWQDGYEVPSGLANVEVTVKLAQTDELVRSVIRGKTADKHGFMTIDGGGTSVRYVLYTEEIFKNGDIRRRIAAVAGIKSVKEDKSERGSAVGYETTFSISRSPLLNNEHIGEWLIPSSAVPAKTPASPPARPPAVTE